jgi:Fe-S-cluster-containing dehydrogenase component/formate-dependent nitrite reductase membrane component NrfD
MPNYGFAIDLRKCIGCHACTIACKVEHQIPIGVNRCWVKTVEKGTFPATRRFFFPVLCNQCDAAPCVTICPTRALYKRRDGIVDLHSDVCIGCRACMVACPYDQLFIDPNTHTAEKCNFCANRVENELLPSCVIVCPTECRIFGDLDDPSSEVARIAMAAERGEGVPAQRDRGAGGVPSAAAALGSRGAPGVIKVALRKPEKGTQPKVFYIGAEESAIQPEIAARPFIYKEGQVLLRPLGSPAPDPDRPGDARVDYDTPHVKPWGVDMAIYLLTKGIATGTMLLCALLAYFFADRSALTMTAGPIISLTFLLITTIVLVVDLERPERFYYMLIRPNWRSWMVWGTWFLIAHGAITTLWLAAGWFGATNVVSALVWPAVVCSLVTTCYTGFLFAQGLARDLWQGPQSTLDLLAQAVAEGAAALLIAAALMPDIAYRAHPRVVSMLGVILIGAIVIHLAFLIFENLLAPSPTRHHALAVAAIRRGPFARMFWAGAMLISIAAIVVSALAGGMVIPLALAAVLALAGSFAWEYVWVEAGQSVPLS